MIQIQVYAPTQTGGVDLPRRSNGNKTIVFNGPPTGVILRQDFRIGVSEWFFEFGFCDGMM